MNAVKTLLLVFLLVSLLLPPNFAFAAEKQLSWAECLALASENNDELKSSEKSLNSYEFSVSGSYSTFFPQITASANYSNNDVDPKSYSASLTATETLFNGFQDMARIDQSKANRDVALFALQTTRAKISYDLKSAVSNLLYAQNYVSLSKNILQRREMNLKTVQLRFESGRENKGSLLLSKAYLEDAKLDQLKARQNLFVAQTQLAKVLGQEDTLEFNLNDAPPISEPQDEAAVDFKSLVLQTPAYKQAVAQESLSQAGVTLAQGNFYPTFSLSATAGDTGTTWYPDAAHRNTLGATLTLPLFNGGRDYNATRSARENLKSSNFARANVLKEQLVTLKSAYVTYLQATQKLRVDQAYVEASIQREKVSRSKYNNGLSTFDEWDIIQNDLINRQKSLLISQRDRVVQEAAWEQAQGKGVLP